jgi:hypothetical protein
LFAVAGLSIGLGAIVSMKSASMMSSKLSKIRF